MAMPRIGRRKIANLDSFLPIHPAIDAAFRSILRF
jgi:hypothetical protein